MLDRRKRCDKVADSSGSVRIAQVQTPGYSKSKPKTRDGIDTESRDPGYGATVGPALTCDHGVFN
jgi:hypothetical protein